MRGGGKNDLTKNAITQKYTAYSCTVAPQGHIFCSIMFFFSPYSYEFCFLPPAKIQTNHDGVRANITWLGKKDANYYKFIFLHKLQ